MGVRLVTLTDRGDLPKDGGGVAESGAVPAAHVELVLALLNAHLGTRPHRLKQPHAQFEKKSFEIDISYKYIYSNSLTIYCSS